MVTKCISRGQSVHMHSWIYMWKNTVSHLPALLVRLVASVYKDGGSASWNWVAGIFQPPALTTWMFSQAECPQLDYFYFLFLDCVAHLSPGQSSSQTVWLLVSRSYLQSATDQIIGQRGMLSSFEGNKKKERTVKSDRNSVYGAPERSCLLELVMEVCVTCKATSCWAYSGIFQMVF